MPLVVHRKSREILYAKPFGTGGTRLFPDQDRFGMSLGHRPENVSEFKGRYITNISLPSQSDILFPPPKSFIAKSLNQ